MKTYFLTALSFEAEPLIKAFNMKCEIPDGPFKVYCGENTVLSVSGVGDLNASAAVSFVCGKYPPEDGDIFVNFGICGAASENFSVGDTVCVQSLTRDGSRPIYTDLFFDISGLSVKEAEIPRDVCEMEAYGAAYSAAKFFTTDRVFILKTVSDVASETNEHGGKIDKKIARRVCENAVGTLLKFVALANKFYEENTQKPYDFSENERIMLENAAKKLKLSYQSTKILENHFWKMKLLGRPAEFYPEEVKDKKQGEIILRKTVNEK